MELLIGLLAIRLTRQKTPGKSLVIAIRPSAIKHALSRWLSLREFHVKSRVTLNHVDAKPVCRVDFGGRGVGIPIIL